MLSVLAVLVLLATAMPATAAAAAAPTIRGTLANGSGFTVIALFPDGHAMSSAVARNGHFKLAIKRSKLRDATLQLVDRDGNFYGPVVLRHAGKKAFTSLRGRPVRLGKIALRGGYAVPRNPVPALAVDLRAPARADKRGKPVGAGRLGLVRKARQSKSAATDEGGPDGGQPGLDPDADGVPNPADADDDGDLVLDGSDPDTSTAQSGGLFSDYRPAFQGSLNANAGTVSLAQIDAAVRDSMALVFYFDEDRLAGPGGSAPSVTSSDVDCFELVYCRRGDGTAIISGLSDSSPGLPLGSPWVGYDPNGDGLPNLGTSTSSPPAYSMGVNPRVGTGDIAPGNTFEARFTTSSGLITIPMVLPFYFVTVPAMQSYDAGGGSQAVSYPIPDGAPGTGGNPIPLPAGRISVTFWRPQRPAVPGAESGTYTDMGHLHYGMVPLNVGSGEFGCRDEYSGLAGLTMMPASSDPFSQLMPLTDGADDAPTNPANTLSLAVDLGACLRRNGVDPTGLKFSVDLMAIDESRPGGADRAAQNIWVQMP